LIPALFSTTLNIPLSYIDAAMVLLCNSKIFSQEATVFMNWPVQVSPLLNDSPFDDELRHVTETAMIKGSGRGCSSRMCN